MSEDTATEGTDGRGMLPIGTERGHTRFILRVYTEPAELPSEVNVARNRNHTTSSLGIPEAGQAGMKGMEQKSLKLR
jgi:hypothetical protein